MYPAFECGLDVWPLARVSRGRVSNHPDALEAH